MTLMCVAALTLAPHEADAQGFLKKLKQKAEKVMGKTADAEEETDASADQDNTAAATPTATDRLPKLRQSTVVWDGEIQPSRASSARALMNELPPLPTVDELANPDDATREAYYRSIVAVSMRAEELDEQQGCSDEEMLAARDKIYKELEGITGLTVDEMKRLEDPNTSEAERLRLEEKMTAHITGGADVEGMATKAKSKEARIKELEKEVKALEAKEKAGTLTEADKKRAMEIQQEMMAIHQDVFGDLGGIMNTANKAAALNMKVQADMARFNGRLKTLSDKISAARKNEEGVVKSCSEIADEYEAQLKAIYERVWAENDADTIHALYDKADVLVKNYRTRAAKIYLRGLQLRLDNTKKLMPEAEKLYAEMADCELIPQCAMRRAPLNLVIGCTDILHEAYTHFPQPDVLPVKKETFKFLNDDEGILFAESGFPGGFSGSGGGGAPGSGAPGSGGSGSGIVEEFVAGSCLLVYNSTEKCYYEVKAGKRRKLNSPSEMNNEGMPAAHKPYGDIPLRKAGRKAVYSRDGSLTLHDGTSLYPLAMKLFADRLEIIVYMRKDINNISQYDFYKCTYKL